MQGVLKFTTQDKYSVVQGVPKFRTILKDCSFTGCPAINSLSKTILKDCNITGCPEINSLCKTILKYCSITGCPAISSLSKTILKDCSILGFPAINSFSKTKLQYYRVYCNKFTVKKSHLSLFIKSFKVNNSSYKKLVKKSNFNCFSLKMI